MSLENSKETDFGAIATFFFITSFEVTRKGIDGAAIRARMDGWPDRATWGRLHNGFPVAPICSFSFIWKTPFNFDLTSDIIPQLYQAITRLPDWVDSIIVP